MPLTPAQTQSPRSAGRFHSMQTRMVPSFGLASLAILVTLEYIGLWGVPFTRWNGRVEDFKAEAVGWFAIDRRPEGRAAPLVARRPPQGPGHLGRRALRVVQLQSLLNEMEHLTAKGLRGRALWTRLREQAEYQLIVSRLEEIHRTYPDFRRIFIADAKSGTVIASTDDADLVRGRGRPAVFPPAGPRDRRFRGWYVSGGQGARARLLHRSRRCGRPRTGPSAVMVAEVQDRQRCCGLCCTRGRDWGRMAKPC